MKIGNRDKKWTVDWAGQLAEPKVGHVVHRFTPTQQDAGFWRVTSVRQVQPRRPLDPGYWARYAVTAQFIGDEFRPSDWVLHCHNRPRQRQPRVDRFSPLLPPNTPEN